MAEITEWQNSARCHIISLSKLKAAPLYLFMKKARSLTWKERAYEGSAGLFCRNCLGSTL